ncbi:type II toxin-antitoxin system prevent-host-death family antitoxin [Luteolibacter pohnpeiensis]|uniref:Antitoxin n=1 Tax=Luteolibacter pohnpeiensis TaxID=454153 RepID=A0A934S7P0_9BACT|nr:type II toxin-antitoxin system prevent-host-death family antitoxin [Luteolibacter pohnpeiensis]MBK1881217.1 type II toxin-antitoxin system prevent-host-death family antitoxin [Luteolibacter pohnpeiensis]
MKTATVREAQHHLAKLLAEVEKGEEIVLTRRGKPVGKLVPTEVKRSVVFPNFGKIRKRLGTDEIKGPNEVLLQRGEAE